MLFIRILILSFWAVFIAGCGSDLKLSVRAAESEKDQPSTQLVRKVELSYHDASGSEKMRESVPVLGLSQPVSFKSDLVKDLEVEEGGRFEARAYSGDGYQLLHGSSQVPAEADDGIEIVMGRDGFNQVGGVSKFALSSPTLRKIKVAHSNVSSEFALDARFLQESAIQNNCAELPLIQINAGSGVFPSLILESSIFGAAYQYEAGQFENGNFVSWGGLQSTVLGATGEPIIELGKNFYQGRLLQSSKQFLLRLRSSHEEGCLKVSTKIETAPLNYYFRLADGHGESKRNNSGGICRFFRDSDEAVLPMAVFTVANPNSVATEVNLNFSLYNPTTNSSVPVYYFPQFERKKESEMKLVPVYQGSFQVAPNSKVDFAIFGGRPLYQASSIVPPPCFMSGIGMNFRWSASSRVVGDVGVFVHSTGEKEEKIP